MIQKIKAMTNLDKINNEIIKKQDEQILDLKAHIRSLNRNILDLREKLIFKTIS